VKIGIPNSILAIEATTDAQGRAAIDFALTGATLWTPRHAKLYEVVISTGADYIAEKIGFRTFDARRGYSAKREIRFSARDQSPRGESSPRRAVATTSATPGCCSAGQGIGRISFASPTTRTTITWLASPTNWPVALGGGARLLDPSIGTNPATTRMPPTS